MIYFKTIACIVSLIMSCTMATASETGTGSDGAAGFRRRAREDMQYTSPVDIADFFVALDNNRDYRQDPKRNPIDPLKLQKLVYYAFSHVREHAGIDLWDFDRNPLIANFNGPFNRAVHDKYNGYFINQNLADSNLERVYALDEESKLYLETVYYMNLSKTGRELESESHQELPYFQVSLRQRLCKEDITKEFRKMHHILRFLKALNIICQKKGQSQILVSQFKRAVQKFSVKDFANCLDLENAENICSIDVSWARSAFMNEFGFQADQPIIESVLGIMVYPQSLLNQVDARDSVFTRPEVVERVALAVRFGYRQAIKDLRDIFRLFSIDANDNYDRTVSVLNSILEEQVVSSDNPQPRGYSAYKAAFEQENLLDAVRLYKQSLNEGYARAAFELSKMSLAEENIPEAIGYAKKAFNEGMLTVTDFMIDLSMMTEDDKQNFLEKRVNLGDPKGYYDLARFFEQRKNMERAITYYKKSLPFYGYSDLSRLHEEISEDDIDRFFAEIVLIINNESVCRIWDTNSSNVAQQQ